jgi:hypothetical protein
LSSFSFSKKKGFSPPPSSHFFTKFPFYIPKLVECATEREREKKKKKRERTEKEKEKHLKRVK